MTLSTNLRRAGSGLRSRVTLTFAAGAALVSLALAVLTFTISRGYLDSARERAAARQAATDAASIERNLERTNISPGQALAVADPPTNTFLLLYWDGQWYPSVADLGPEVLPSELRTEVPRGTAAVLPVTFRGEQYLAAGVPAGDGMALYELFSLTELRETLEVLRAVLIVSGIAATIAGAATGRWASKKLLHPLRTLAGTASEIAAGALDVRLTNQRDRDLEPIAQSFNRMVGSLQQRIERERRFFGDVSHELRTPLTTLMTSLEVLRRQSDELPRRSRHAVELATAELAHLRRLLEDLLALARAEAGLQQDMPETASLQDLLEHTVLNSGRDLTVLDVVEDSSIRCRKLALERAFTNLMDNADRHGRGLVGVRVHRTAAGAEVLVDDAGPGVPAADRERIFERFATGRAGRGSSAGTGLGLALVAETIAAHGGEVRCEDRPGGGARMVVMLPVAEDTTDDASDDNEADNETDKSVM
ncbi:ATP-binding protein [Actinophytocola sp. NPDC049390]|uniref:sensor histidine kinase n=1 Tax=Actinophytocola sp. NPDC049390 TaxID=3363894 RepID=UPI00379408EE